MKNRNRDGLATANQAVQVISPEHQEIKLLRTSHLEDLQKARQDVQGFRTDLRMTALIECRKMTSPTGLEIGGRNALVTIGLVILMISLPETHPPGNHQRVLPVALVALVMIPQTEIVPIALIVLLLLRQRQQSRHDTQLNIQMNRRTTSRDNLLTNQDAPETCRDGREMINLGVLETRSQGVLGMTSQGVLGMTSQVVLGMTSPDVLVMTSQVVLGMTSQVVLGMTSQDAPVISQDVPVMKNLVDLATNHQMTDLRGGRQRVLQDALVDLVMILQIEIVPIAQINTLQQQGQLSRLDTQLNTQMNQRTTSRGNLLTNRGAPETSRDGREMINLGVLETRSQGVLGRTSRSVREMISQVVLTMTSPDVLVMKSQVVLGMTSQDAPVISQDVPVMKDLVGLATNHQMTDLRGGRQRVLQDALVDLVMILQTEIVPIALIVLLLLRQRQLSLHDTQLNIQMNRRTTSRSNLLTNRGAQETSRDGREMINLGVLETRSQGVLGMTSQSVLEMTSQSILGMTSQGVLGMTSQDALMISQDVPVMKNLVGLATDHQMTDLRGGRQRVLQDALVDLVMILLTEIVPIAPINTPPQQEQL